MNRSKMRTPGGLRVVAVEALTRGQAEFLMTGSCRGIKVPRPGRHKLQALFGTRATYLFCDRSGQFFAYTFDMAGVTRPGSTNIRS